MVQKTFQFNEFWPFKLLSKNSKVYRDSNSQSESPLGNVWAHSLTFSCFPRNVSVTTKLHFRPAPFHALALVTNPRPRLRSRHYSWIREIHMVKMMGIIVCVRWKSFKVYHTWQKGLNPYCSPFLPYILIPVKNNESKVVKFFKTTIF
jgi:hypothetical protein